MPRTPSAEALAAMFGHSTTSIFLTLLEIGEPGEDPILRIVDDLENVTSNGDVYTAFGFTMKMPDSTGERMSKVKISIDNTTGQFTEAFRAVDQSLDVTMSIVLREHPDIIEAGPFTFKLRNLERDQSFITGECTHEPIHEDGWPQMVMGLPDWPGLF